MKLTKITTLLLAGLLCLAMTACGNDNGTAPAKIDSAPYDSAAECTGYDDFIGLWEGTDGAAGDTLEVTPTDGGMYFLIYNGEEVAVSGTAQEISEYGCLYFFNQNDGNAYRTEGGTDGLTIGSFGTYVWTEALPDDEYIEFDD